MRRPVYIGKTGKFYVVDEGWMYPAVISRTDWEKEPLCIDRKGKHYKVFDMEAEEISGKYSIYTVTKNNKKF